MTRDELMMVKAMEECAEVAQRLSKAVRFGIHQVQTGQVLANRDRIIDEWHDLVVTMELLQLNTSISVDERVKRMSRIDEYMTFSLWQREHWPHLHRRGGEEFDIDPGDGVTRKITCPCGSMLLTLTK